MQTLQNLFWEINLIENILIQIIRYVYKKIEILFVLYYMLKNNKSPSADGLETELLMKRVKELIKWIWNLIRKSVL